MLASFSVCASPTFNADYVWNCRQVGERGNCPLTEVTHVLRPAEIRKIRKGRRGITPHTMRGAALPLSQAGCLAHGHTADKKATVELPVLRVAPPSTQRIGFAPVSPVSPEPTIYGSLKVEAQS